MRKSVVSLYTNNELSEKEIKKQSHLKQHQKQKKRLRNKFSQRGIRFVTESYETKMKVTRENTNK